MRMILFSLLELLLYIGAVFISVIYLFIAVLNIPRTIWYGWKLIYFIFRKAEQDARVHRKVS
jgi:hypothetical protein